MVDVETLKFPLASPYSTKGKLVSIHCHHSNGYSTSHKPDDRDVQIHIDYASVLIGLNFKFDLAWLRRTGFNFEGKKIWDVQLAHFLLSGQTAAFPSLNEVLEFYGFEQKLDVVKEQYWNKNIDTDQVPWEILCEYGEYDCLGTYQCYLKQLEAFRQQPELFKLFKLQCQDLLVLLEMEWNGLKYNSKRCEEKSAEIGARIEEINGQLSSVYPDIRINFNSGDQLSAFLYGGTIVEEVREIIGFYKTGAKLGQPRFRVGIKEHLLPTLLAPLPRSELKKPGTYATDEGTLKKLKGTARAKGFVTLLLELAKLEKVRGTYYEGLNKLNREYAWPEGMLHPTYNQCNARTGRLSSSKPNGQNMSGEILEIFESQYDS